MFYHIVESTVRELCLFYGCRFIDDITGFRDPCADERFSSLFVFRRMQLYHSFFDWFLQGIHFPAVKRRSDLSEPGCGQKENGRHLSAEKQGRRLCDGIRTAVMEGEYIADFEVSGVV